MEVGGNPPATPCFSIFLPPRRPRSLSLTKVKGPQKGKQPSASQRPNCPLRSAGFALCVLIKVCLSLWDKYTQFSPLI